MELRNKLLNLIIPIILLVVGLVVLPIVVDASFDANNDNITDSFPGCVVAGGETDVVLTQDLTDDNIIYVSAITATGAGAVPVADSYVAGTNTLTVSGLGVDTPQDLTVTYSYSAVDDYTGVEAMLRILPFLTVVGVILVSVVWGLWEVKGIIKP